MNYAIILSGGIGTRMRSDGFPKQYIEINHKPILIYTLEKFENNLEIDKIIVVAAEQWENKIKEWSDKYGISKLYSIASPGETRQESIFNGLKACMEINGEVDDMVIIHDAVRPLVSDHLISSCISALNEYDGCLPVLPVNDTIYQSTSGNAITQLLKRETLFAGQAPEAFRLREYYEINADATKEELARTRGTSEIAYKHGMNICLIEGDDMNFKLTTPADLNRFRVLINAQNKKFDLK